MFTNGVGFGNPVIAGDGELVIDDIHSRNYVPGSAGWSIKRDGSAEFGNTTLRGSVQSSNFESGVAGWILEDTGYAQLNGRTDVNGTATFTGEVLLEKPWVAYVPGWSSSLATQPSFGNAGIQAWWKNLGTMAEFKMAITFGTTTTFGSGAWGFTLPIDPDPNGYSAASAIMVDDSATARYTGAAWLTNTSGIFRVAYGGTAGISSTVPFTWAPGDTLIVSGSYHCITLA